jgi:hypothetical protein
MTQAANTVRSLVSEVERDLARLIRYMNDEVVPEVRRGFSCGLRAAAEQMGRAAEHLDRGPNRRTTAPPRAK